MATTSDERFGDVTETEKPAEEKPKTLDEDRFEQVVERPPMPPNRMAYLESRDLEITKMKYKEVEAYTGGREWSFLLTFNDLSALESLSEKEEIAFWFNGKAIKPGLLRALAKIRKKDPQMLVTNPDSELEVKDADFELQVPLPVVITKDRTKKVKKGKRRAWEMVSPGEFQRRLGMERAKPLDKVRLPWDKEEDSEGE